MPRARPETTTSQFAGEAHGRGRRVARADDRCRGPVEQHGVALDRQRGRRGFGLAEEERVIGVDDENEAPAEARDGGEFGLGDGDPGCTASTPDAVGQRRQHVRRRAAAMQQLTVGDGTDVVTADQAQAVDIVSVRSRDTNSGGAHLAPIFGSVRMRRRAILSRCLKISSAAMAHAATVQVASSGTVVRAMVNSTALAIAAIIPPTDE